MTQKRGVISHWPWIKDLAVLEWGWSGLGLRTDSLGRGGLRLHPSVSLFRMNFDVLNFWKLFEKDKTTRLIEPTRRQQCLVIWQNDDKNYIDEIDERLFVWISELKDNKGAVVGAEKKLTNSNIKELRRRGWVLG